MPLVTVSIWSRVVRWSSTRGRGGGEVKKGDRTLLVRGREDPCSSMGIQCLPVEKLNWSLCQYRPRLSSLFPRTVYTCVTFLNPPRIRKAFFSLSTYLLPSLFPARPFSSYNSPREVTSRRAVGIARTLLFVRNRTATGVHRENPSINYNECLRRFYDLSAKADSVCQR